MTLVIWLKPITINEIIVMLHKIGSFAGDGSQVELEADHLKIRLDIAVYTDDPSEQQSILEELISTIASRPFVKKVESLR